MATTIDKRIKLDNREFQKAIAIAKKYRKANKMLDSAIANYVGLAKEDRAASNHEEWG